MEKKDQHELDKWRGSLQSVWEEDTTTPSSLDWDSMRAHLPSTKRWRRIFWIRLSSAIVLTVTLLLALNQMDSDETSDDLKLNSPKKEIRTNSEVIPQRVQLFDSKYEGSSNIDENVNDESKHKNQNVVSFSQGEHSNINFESFNHGTENGVGDGNRFQNGDELDSGFKEILDKSSNNIHESIEKSVVIDLKQTQGRQTDGIINEDLNNFRFRTNENNILDSMLCIDSKPIFPLPVNYASSIGFLPFKPVKRRLRFSYQLGVTAGRSIRIIGGQFDEGLQTRSISARRIFLPMRGLIGALNWHLNEQWSLQGGVRIGGGTIQTRWIFKSFPTQESSQELRLQSSDGDVVIHDPTLISQINNGVGGLYQLRLNYDYRIWSLPVGVSYRLNNKPFSPVIRTGLNAEWIGRRSLSIDISENGQIRNIPLTIEQNQIRKSIQQYFALGLSWRLSEKLNLYSDFCYYKPWTNMINASGYRVRSSALNMELGLMYYFQ